MLPRELAGLAIGVYGAMQKHEELLKLADFFTGHSAHPGPGHKHENIMEIGSGRGGTLWMWCHLPEAKTVISIDLPGGPFGGGLTPEDQERINNWIDPKQSTYLASRNSHDATTLEEVKESLGGKELDVLFIDGDHTYAGVKLDYEMYSHLVRDTGIIVFHDICEHPPETGCDVRKFWLELKESDKIYKGLTREFISEPTNWGGIGLVVNKR